MEARLCQLYTCTRCCPWLVFTCVTCHAWCVQALGTLASRHVGLLRGYSSYLANILDHLEGFSNKQLQQVFSMFAALTAREPAASAAAAAGGAGGAGGSSSAAGAQWLILCQQWLCQVNTAALSCVLQPIQLHAND